MDTGQNRTDASLVLGTEHFQGANERVRAALVDHDEVTLEEVYAQRYLGCAMPEGKRLNIHGVPGNDMASYLDGGVIEVFGNAQDQIGNTMNDGLVVVHGRCGDAAGYAMRGGEIFVRDDCGWRVGIHMKQFERKRPVIFIGGDAGNFLGEYMAGGAIVLLGRPGDHLATGMHGGVIYLLDPPDATSVPKGLVLETVDRKDEVLLGALLERYNGYFAEDGRKTKAQPKDFLRLRPASSRPYADMYAH